MKRHTAVILLVALFSLFYRIIFFTGPAVSDEFAYLQYAHNIASGQLHLLEGTWYAFRYMVFSPVAVLFKFFGINDYIVALWPLFCSIGTVILIYMLGVLLFDKSVGLLAAILLSIFPLDVLYATHLMPDTILPFFMALTVYLFLKAETPSSGKKALFFYLFSGVALGLGYLSREVAPVLFILFFSPYVLYTRKLAPKILFFGLGFVGVVLMEICFYYFATGNMFLRWQVLNEFYGAQSLSPEHFYYLKSVFAPLGYSGLFYYFVVFGAFYLFFRKKLKDIAIVLIWFMGSLLYWQFGTMSLLRYAPIFKEARFLTQLSVPALLIAAYSLVQWQRSFRNGIYVKYAERILIFMVFAAIIALPVLSLFKENVFMIIEFMYKITKHYHSFEENKTNIVAVYRVLSGVLPLLIAAAGITSFAILRISNLKTSTKLVSLVILMILLPSSFVSATIYSKQYKYSMGKYKKVYNFITQVDACPFYFINGRWPVIVSYYFRYKKGAHFLKRNFLKYPSENQTQEFKYLQNMKNISELNNAYVVIDKEFLRDFLGGKPPPALSYDIPKTWELKFSMQDVAVYHVNNY
ncbi:MAG: glycosyltransferase family 39 protein [Candidatus Omnitrophota bacterium]